MGKGKPSWLSGETAVIAAGVVAIGVAVAWASVSGSGAESAADDEVATEIGAEPAPGIAPATAPEPPMPDLDSCPPPPDSARRGPQRGNPEARAAAQKGLTYLAGAATEWQQRKGCYGCHVQAVTVEAFAVGKHHRYDVAGGDLTTVIGGMLDGDGGARGDGGLGHFKEDIARTAKVLGAAAFARYDQWIDSDLTDFLLAEADALRAMQRDDGSIDATWGPRPVVAGSTQFAALAVVTWKQAFERTADSVWLEPVQRAEAFLQQRVADMVGEQPDLQELDYAIIGLLAAGVGRTEATMVDLADRLADRQNGDGGWAFVSGEPSEPFATGQALYALRLMGMTDADAVVADGTRYLIDHQADDGSWSDNGFDKAEAMWAVLGLVSLDVLTVTVDGIAQGQSIDGAVKVRADARDNAGGGVVKVEMMVDDIRVDGACGPSLTHEWDTSALAPGKHIVDVLATNARGEVSRRRFEVFTGGVKITQLGTRWSNGATSLTMRQVADDATDIEVEIFETEEVGGVVTAKRKVDSMRVRGQQGPVNLDWGASDRSTEGDGTAKPIAGGTYMARVIVRDGTGDEVQREEVEFVHASAEEQERAFAQVEGTLRLGRSGARGGGSSAEPAPAANTEVELVDDRGNVVQRTRTTSTGRYRFKNVRAEKSRRYKVRAKKSGFAAPPAPLDPFAAGDTAAADVDLMAE